jgi:ribonuclease G
MPENILVVNAEGSEIRIGLLEGETLVEYFLERRRERGISGNIYKARVSRVLPGMQAAFVDLGQGVDRKAYLYVAEVRGAGDERGGRGQDDAGQRAPPSPQGGSVAQDRGAPQGGPGGAGPDDQGADG